MSARCLLALALLAAGCASVPADAGFDDVRRRVALQSGLDVQWTGRTLPEPEVEDAVRGLLTDGLSIDEAVQVGLLWNQDLQATYEELGIAQADLVSAGLLSNPVFFGHVRFPDGGVSGTNIEIGIAENFIELLTLSLRKRVAAARFEEAKLRVCDAVLALARDVRVAYRSLQAAEQMLELRRQVAEAGDAAAYAADRLHEAGNVTDLDLASERALAAQSRLDLEEAEVAAIEARERLVALLGLWGADTAFAVDAHLPEAPPDVPDVAGLESRAIAQRLDLAAARASLEALARELGAVRRQGGMEQLELGVDGERELDGEWVIGPTFAFTLPIFDQGQPAAARASARLVRAERQVAALAVSIRSQVRAARARLDSAARRARYHLDVLLPLRGQVVEQTQLEYNGMLVGVFQLLQAREAQIDAGAGYVHALRDAWIARAELEYAVGGTLPESASPAESTPPEPAPAPPTQPESQHVHHPGGDR